MKRARKWGFMALLVAAASRADVQTLVIASGNCQDGDLLANAKLLAEALKKRLGDELLDPRELSAKFGASASKSVEEIQAELEAAKVQYYSSEYLKARDRVEDALREIRRLPVGAVRWSLTISAELLYALVLKQSNAPAEADEAFSRALRLTPEVQLDPDYYSPSTIGDFERVRKIVLAAHKGHLLVRSNPSAAEVYLDGLRVGVTPFNGSYPSARYEVVVAKDGLVSLPHQVEVEDSEVTHIDLEFEGTLNTRSLFCVSNAGDERAWVSAAVKIASLIGADEVVVARLQRPSPSSTWLTASLVSAATAGKTREAGLKAKGPGPSPDEFEKLANFIVTGKADGAVVVVDTHTAAPAPWAPRPPIASASEDSQRSPARRWRIASYAAWGTGSLALASAGVLFLINQRDLIELKKYERSDGSIMDSREARHLLTATDARRHWATGLLVGGGIGVVSGTICHFIAKKAEAPVEITARLQPAGATLSLAASF
jgi:hypothetical protein